MAQTTPSPALSFGTDGRIYATTEGLDPRKLRGRERFIFYRLTRDEARHALEQIRLIAPNVTVGLPRQKKRRSP
jgi:hypothetical protein